MRLSRLITSDVDMRRVAASDRDHVAWFGNCENVSGTIVYSMPGVRFVVRVRGATRVSAKMFGGYGFFTVVVQNCETGESVESTVSPQGTSVETVSLASGLDPEVDYDVMCIKKSEPELRSILTCFESVVVETVRINSGTFIPINAKSVFYPNGWIEAIGDSDACGFGVDGPISGPSNIFSMDPEAEDVNQAWGTQLAILMRLGRHACLTVAASGKGIASNAPMCGYSTLPDVWEEQQARATWMMPVEPPIGVFVLAGGNDFFGQVVPDRDTFVDAFRSFLGRVRYYRGPMTPIHLFQCSSGCCSSAGSPSVHPSKQFDVVVACEALASYSATVVKTAQCEGAIIRFEQLITRLDFPSHYGIMMHWNRRGQRAIAREMHRWLS